MEFDISVVAYGMPILLKGLVNTILYCLAAIVCGSVLAVAVALARLSRRTVLRWPAVVFIEIIRNTPFLVQAFIIFFVLPSFGLRLSPSAAGILVLTSYVGAFFAESIRGAIESVPKGQMDAARALGLSYIKGMRLIVFPQMLGYLIPSLTNQIIGVIKESAVLSVVTVPELSMAGQRVLGVAFSPVETYAMVGVLYWALTATVAFAMMRAECRLTGVPGGAVQSAKKQKAKTALPADGARK
jgi:His/Glu/Gln/Arg/opine family amino acid ABC transporter permease subunit